MNSVLILGGLALLGAGALLKGKSAHAGAIPPQGEITFVTGKSGTQYAVEFGVSASDGQTLTVHNTEMQPLFAYVQTHGGPRFFEQAFDGAEPGELAKALADFQPMINNTPLNG